MANEPKLQVLIKRLPGTKDVPIPTYRSAGAAGMDLHAAVEQDLIIGPTKTELIPCGFAIAIPAGYEGQVRPRSGLTARHGLVIPNSPGTIDSDYRGEIKVLLSNNGTQEFRVERGMRIAQLIVLPVSRVEWQEVEDLPPTERGKGGFGHTGK
jgi:dUTP pyrophosphatase